MAAFNISYHHSIINYNCNTRNSPNFCPSLAFKKPPFFPRKKLHIFAAVNKNVTQQSAMTSGGRIVKEVLPPVLDSSSDPPAIFDGNPKLYISYNCPYAQRVWITRNCKGLQETIKLVAIDLKNRPSWYKEKVYPANKLPESLFSKAALKKSDSGSGFVEVPSLEYNNEVKGESLDLIQYINENFEGPSLFPDDPVKRKFGEELLSSAGSFYKAVITSLKEDRVNEAGAAFDDIETALSRFDDGPFFLGQFSLVDIAYVPFVERLQPFVSEVKNYDITKGRKKLALWIEEMNNIEGYIHTRRDPKDHVESYKKRFLV